MHQRHTHTHTHRGRHRETDTDAQPVAEAEPFPRSTKNNWSTATWVTLLTERRKNGTSHNFWGISRYSSISSEHYDRSCTWKHNVRAVDQHKSQHCWQLRSLLWRLHRSTATDNVLSFNIQQATPLYRASATTLYVSRYVVKLLQETSHLKSLGTGECARRSLKVIGNGAMQYATYRPITSHYSIITTTILYTISQALPLLVCVTVYELEKFISITRLI